MWECAYASVWVRALFPTLQPFTSTSFASFLSHFLRRVLIVRNVRKEINDFEEIQRAASCLGAFPSRPTQPFPLTADVQTLQCSSLCSRYSYSIDLCIFGSRPDWKHPFRALVWAEFQEQ